VAKLGQRIMHKFPYSVWKVIFVWLMLAIIIELLE